MLIEPGEYLLPASRVPGLTDLDVYGLSMAVAAVCVFNIEGISDLIYANISTFEDQVDPASLGAAYYLAAINVPAMIVVHVLIFMYLLRRRQM